MSDFPLYRTWVDQHYPGKWGTGTIAQQCARRRKYGEAKAAARHSSAVEQRVDNAQAPGSNPGAGTKLEACLSYAIETKEIGVNQPLSYSAWLKQEFGIDRFSADFVQNPENEPRYWPRYRAYYDNAANAGKTQVAPNPSVPQRQETTMVYDVIATVTGEKEVEGIQTKVQRKICDQRGLIAINEYGAVAQAALTVAEADVVLIGTAAWTARCIA